MKYVRILLFSLFIVIEVEGQTLSLDNLLQGASLSPGKCNHFLNQKGFVLVNEIFQRDTQLQVFRYFAKSKKRDLGDKKDPLDKIEYVHKSTTGEDLILTYQTNFYSDFENMVTSLSKDGFWNRSPIDSIKNHPVLFQKLNFTVIAAYSHSDSQEVYTFKVKKRSLPEFREIIFAEDLLVFDSHEQLAFVFGPANVKNDIYFFSDGKFSRCSVLFPNTDRQAVFIWKDEEHDLSLSMLVLGGQLALKNTVDYDKIVKQNSWISNSGLHAGMSLRELRRMNENDFQIHNVNSTYSGMVVPEVNGKIDFREKSVVLACLNCHDLKDMPSSTISADEAIRQGRRFFVFSIMLHPDSD